MKHLSKRRLDSSKFAAPVEDPRFVALDDNSRQLVLQRLSAMQRIASAPNISKEIHRISLLHDGARGWSVSSMSGLWYKFWGSQGAWTVLLDKAKAGSKYWQQLNDGGLPQAFREYLGEEWSANQKDKFRAFWIGRLIPRWQAWRRGDAKAAIKGYDHCPEADPKTGLPPGWSYRNLKSVANREAKAYHRKLIQIGSKKASEMSVPILSSREGVEVGQFPFYDDSWDDCKFLYKGKMIRTLSLHSLDLASGCNVIRGFKPAVKDEKEVMEGLKSREMIYLVAAQFSTEGFHPNGTVMICEKQTATVSAEVESLLAQITDDKILVQRGPMGGGPGIAGLFNGRAAGTPRWKAPMESFHNIVRNRTASLLEFPAQMGNNQRINGPEGLSKIEVMDEAMARAMQILPPDKQNLIKFNSLSFWEGMPVLNAIIELINTRTDHKLEGWRKCGHYIPVVRSAVNMPWRPTAWLATLSEAEQRDWQMLLASDPLLTGEQPLSPRQVYNAGRGRLKKFTPIQTALLLTSVGGDERPVDGGLLEVNCPDVDPDEPLRFGPIIRDLEGRERAMQIGDKWLVRVNPYKPEVAFLYNADGGFAGLATAWGRNARPDFECVKNGVTPEKLQEAFKTKHKVVSEWTREARKIALPITARAVDVVANNARVIRDVEREATKQDRKLDRAARDTEEDFTALSGGEKPQEKETGVSTDEYKEL